MSSYFNSELLSNMIETRRASLGGVRGAAAALDDISPSTLFRIERGSIPSIEDLIEIADWLGVSPGLFFQSTTPAIMTPSDLALLADSRLRPEMSQALATLVRLLVERAGK